MTLSFAVPSKGRMAERSVAWLESLGASVVKPASGRGYSGKLSGAVEADLYFLSASEIPGELAAGSLDFAITGMDVVRENVPHWETRIQEIARLGFGRADLVISVPRFWIDADTLDDLDAIGAQFRRRHGRRLRIATKYRSLVRQFLSGAGVADYQLVFSQGATEGCVANSQADAIADLVSTGRTLEANGLKPLKDATIIRSEAALFQSRASSVPSKSRIAVAKLVDFACRTRVR